MYDGRIPIWIDAPAEIYAVIDPQDLTDLADNLIDKAAVPVTSSVIVTAGAEELRLLLPVSDDAPDIT